VIRGDEERHLAAVQWLVPHIRWHVAVHHVRQVRLPGPHRLDHLPAGPEPQAQLDVRVVTGERPDHGTEEERLLERDTGGQPHSARVPGAQTGDLGGQLRHIPQRAAGQGVDRLPGRCEVDPPPPVHQQAGAEGPFQRLDVKGHGGLTEPEAAGRRRVAALLGHGREHAQPRQGEVGRAGARIHGGASRYSRIRSNY
jgi:hypothetical protein